MGITITNSGQGSVVRFRNLGLGGVMTSSKNPLLLNLYSGAAAAYSLRKINGSYSGAAIRVRRSSDSTEQDISFVNNVLDTTSLSTFVGTQNNLIPYSEDFTQWTLFDGSSINSNVTTDPIGGSTADRLNFGTSTTSQVYYPQSTLTNGVTYVVSLYAKSDTKSNFRFKVSDGVTEVFSPNITINSNWIRYDYTFTNAPIGFNVAIVNESAGGAGAIFIWGYQLNIRTLQTYTQTTGTAKNNNGFITKWYDQSGNFRDAIQATTANQPRIIYGGSITYINGKPTVENIASSYLATTQTSFTTLQTHSDFIVTKGLTQSQPNNYVGYLVFGPSSGNDFGNTVALTINAGEISTGKNLDIGASGYSIIGSGLVTDHRLISHIINSQSGQAFSNRIPIASANGTFATTNNGSLYIGTRYTGGAVNTSYSYLGYFQEIITYNSSQLTNRTAIESNINSYYSIYTPTWQGTGAALLDLYPSSAAAYSLRNLSSTYIGPLIRVRRSSDNNETDVYGTVSGQLDIASLLSFVSAGDGLVTKWYDQSGNARDVAQTNASYQPIIVSSGTVALFGDKPSLYFSPTKAMSNSTFTLAQPNTYFIATQGTSANATGDRNLFDGTGANRNAIGKSNSNSNYFLYAGTLVYSTTPVDAIKNLFVPVFNTTSSFLYKNGNAILSNANPGAQSLQGLRIGAYLEGQAHWESYIPEFIVYNSNQTANRTAIESNINSFYSIY